MEVWNLPEKQNLPEKKVISITFNMVFICIDYLWHLVLFPLCLLTSYKHTCLLLDFFGEEYTVAFGLMFWVMGFFLIGWLVGLFVLVGWFYLLCFGFFWWVVPSWEYLLTWLVHAVSEIVKYSSIELQWIFQEKQRQVWRDNFLPQSQLELMHHVSEEVPLLLFCSSCRQYEVVWNHSVKKSILFDTAYVFKKTELGMELTLNIPLP